MQSKITTSGNSAALRIPAAILKTWGVHVGQSVNVELQGAALVVVPARPRYTLAELLAEDGGASLDDTWLNDGTVAGEAI
jgi:antitoxin ChpS